MGMRFSRFTCESNVDSCGKAPNNVNNLKIAAVSRMKPDPQSLLIRHYTYELPHIRIAEFPLNERDQSKLLVYHDGEINDDRFYHLSHHVPQHSLIIANDTKVIEARMLFQKETGGVIEIFCLEPFRQSVELSLMQTASSQWQCLIGGASKWKPGQLLKKEMRINDEWIVLTAKYIGRHEDNFIIEFSWSPERLHFSTIIHAAGTVPLPPYIKRKATEEDRKTYQTIFSRHEGSVAAPTAALHFTPSVFETLASKKITVGYITLHVGAGTFKPVKTETAETHQMHQEPFTITSATLEKMLQSERIVTVGTTSLRTVESVYWIGVKLRNGLISEDWTLQQWEAYELAEKFDAVDMRDSLQGILTWMQENNRSKIHCHTSLMIAPGYSFKIAKGLITNFHQPQSTLLLLVSAFIGEDWKKVYRHALDNDYRFLSYGDSSLLWRKH